MRMQIQMHLQGPRGGADDPLLATGVRQAKELQRVVFELNGARRIDWKRALRAAFPSRRQVFADYMRPNRRFPQRIGVVPGRRRRPPKPLLMVAVDTSGSMTGAVLDSIAVQLRELQQCARIRIAECDSAVHRMYPFTGPPATFVGGGDTDFAPVFAEAARDSEVAGVIYFTDGKGSMPSPSPVLRTLWVITHNDAFLADFGSVLRMPSL